MSQKKLHNNSQHNCCRRNTHRIIPRYMHNGSTPSLSLSSLMVIVAVETLQPVQDITVETFADILWYHCWDIGSTCVGISCGRHSNRRYRCRRLVSIDTKTLQKVVQQQSAVAQQLSAPSLWPSMTETRERAESIKPWWHARAQRHRRNFYNNSSVVESCTTIVSTCSNVAESCTTTVSTIVAVETPKESFLDICITVQQHHPFHCWDSSSVQLDGNRRRRDITTSSRYHCWDICWYPVISLLRHWFNLCRYIVR